jgi:hypothetical protein
MGLHPGMKFVFTKGKAKGRIGYVTKVEGNEILVTTSKSSYYVNKGNLDKRVRWLRR